MTNLVEMMAQDIIRLLTEFFNYDEEELLEMDDGTLIEVAQETIDEFTESEEYQKIVDSCLIDVDDPDNSLYDILKEWEDINDSSDMYPNGKDDDE